MALDRKYQKIFGKNAGGTDLSIVGSKSEGNPQYSSDVATIQSLSNWETGLRAMVTSSDAPYLQDINSILYVITSQLAYIFQAGTPEWQSQTEYIANRSVVLRNGKIYIAIANSTNVEPEVTSGWLSYWKDLSTINNEYYAVCTSTYSAVKKEITLNNLVPATGTRIKVRFNDLQGGSIKLSDTPYLNIHIGESSINAVIKIGRGVSINSVASFCWDANEIIEFRLVKEGNNWYAICDNIVYRTGLNSGVYYSIRRDGWIEQGGTIDGTTGLSQSVSVTFQRTMVDTNYLISVFPKEGRVRCGSSDDHVDIGIGTTTTTGLTIYFAGSDSRPTKLSWEVKGYIA